MGTAEQLDEIWFQNQYLMQGLCKGGRHPRRPSMLQHMACIHKGRSNDVYSMDMDAITAAYLWSQELFVLETKGVKVNNVTAAHFCSTASYIQRLFAGGHWWFFGPVLVALEQHG